MIPLDKRAAIRKVLGMGIDAQGWFTWAERDPGPPERVNPGVNTLKLVLPHSAEGSWDSMRRTLWGDRGSSWGASNLKNGRFIQHYPVYAQTWTSGAGYPNNNGFAFENEGKAGEPLTPQQVTNIVRVIEDIRTLKKWPETRRPRTSVDKDAQLYEHRECVRWGALGTACPSGRIPWDTILERLGDDDMAITIVACGDSPSGFRLYALGEGPPRWITDPKAANDLQAVFGQPKGLSWAALKALGAA